VTPEQIAALDWQKMAGLLPAVVQDARSGRVLMLGYMDRASLEETLSGGQVVFHSRSRGGRWLKGETSGHYLNVVQICSDCDRDALLILADPLGPTCHLGSASCFAEANETAIGRMAFLAELEQTIERRIAEQPDGSYTARLYAAGTSRIAQKVGEEGVETALAAVIRDDSSLIGEAADLIYHLTVLLKSRNLSLQAVVNELDSRHAARR
jgi:phosphoribosyl-ATP pyrophosphohydrolase/phosphoribosyl-AMP cyclohydrolase